MKKFLVISIGLLLAGIATVVMVLTTLSSNLPKLITVADYEPLLVTEVYARGGEKIGEFFREKRILVEYDDIPENLVNAFVAAEDASFYEHHGINFVAIVRAIIANIKAGRKVQGASTITQQVARSLLLTPDKTYIRKIREMILAYRMENTMSKKDIMYLYLNQIYFGQGAYGISMAAQTYFRKPLKELEIEEMAILAGLPQAPSRYSPVYNPKDAKRRQRYVLRRMADDGYITAEQAAAAAEKNVIVYKRQNFKEIAPYYLETVRQLLVGQLGEKQVLDKGLRVYTGLDYEQQIAANENTKIGLRELDKRQGYRGAQQNLTDAKEIAGFLLKVRDEKIESQSPERVILPDGTNPLRPELSLPELPETIAANEETAGAATNNASTDNQDTKKNKPNLPKYLSIGEIIDGIVIEVDDKWGLVKVRFAEGIGLIDIDSMKWARKPNPDKYFAYDQIKNPSEALKAGDVVQLKVVADQFNSHRINDSLRKMKLKLKDKYERPSELPIFEKWAKVELEQEPTAEAALISFDQDTSEILAMVGGYDFTRSEFNRTIQSARQTGSAFKAIVYAAALDKGYTPATPIIDAPIVYEEEVGGEGQVGDQETFIRRWKPTNHSKKFGGDILFRNALIRSLNVPTVKILQDIGVEWSADYARRLGVFSPLNLDYTLGLGSSGVTLYEITKVFASFGRHGRRIRPLLIHQVIANDGTVMVEGVSLDDRFKQEIAVIEEEFEKKRKEHLELEALKKEEEAINSAEMDYANSEEGQAGLEDEETFANDPTQPNGALADQQVKPKELPKHPQLFFEDPDQLMKPQTAYLITSLLEGAVSERRGTGGRARALGRKVAAKTGTTSGYFDGWFIGYTPQVATGVWVGFDQERSLGKLEVGARNALPIWLEYMKVAHKDLPQKSFAIPQDIIFANIDNETGRLASVNTKNYVRQAFIDGTEPKEGESIDEVDEATNFYKEDLSE